MIFVNKTGENHRDSIPNNEQTQARLHMNMPRINATSRILSGDNRRRKRRDADATRSRRKEPPSDGGKKKKARRLTIGAIGESNRPNLVDTTEAIQRI